jgi:antitoxin component YwqK of YwqJK toxin-antitoxin module
MKRRDFIKASATLCVATVASDGLAQDPVTPPPSKSFLTPEEKREMRKGLIILEMNTDAKGKKEWKDHYTEWDENGFKLVEIEYTNYGLQSERVTFEYDAEGKCIREEVYNDRDKLDRIRKYEYNEAGRKKIQYNYLPNGKLFSTKIFKYSYK